jgi:hypothetical protein
VTDENGVIQELDYDSFGNLLQTKVNNVVLEKNVINKTSIPNYMETKKFLDGSNFVLQRTYFD